LRTHRHGDCPRRLSGGRGYLDCAGSRAASSFFEDGTYRLTRSQGGEKTSADMTTLYRAWLDKYPIISLEDGPAVSLRAHR
jgi:enolase